MASLRVYSVGQLARYLTDTSIKTLRSNVFSTSARLQGTEEKAAEAESDKPATIEDCHKHIDLLSNDLKALQNQVKDLDDKYKRALADGENTRRRMIKQVEDAKSFAIQSFCKDLLEVADTLGAAAESVPDSAIAEGGATLRALNDGVKLTRAQLTQVFNRHGLVAVSPLREKFDPNLHEALFQQEVEGAESGTVVAVSKIGYKLRERCVRPALVGVAK